MDDQKLLKMTKTSFEFLDKDFEFKLVNVQHRGNGLYTLQYRRREESLGIDIQVESIDFGVYILLVSLKNGKDPDGYYVNIKGETVREHLYEYLERIKKLPNGYFGDSRNKYKQFKLANSEDKKYKVVQEILDFKAELLKNNIKYINKNQVE
ncbi:hypothetical protein [Pontibacillus sp. HMF3514]|uniref:hypothetical protein n=1 Tax=Pontibacillus sp. HMF3514 TaxID=2692425 RepID=UPI0013204C91|nr:hypothetical protein [Pontibacillus sp. HMF3514]QHE54028.1 hypothetical protein GS400_19250 [Pontibacillus sp. HMF3514]